MQMGYDFDEGRKSSQPLDRLGQNAGAWPSRGEMRDEHLVPSCPDWRDLKARFIAQHALRHALAVHAVGQGPSGSFLLAAERVLADCREGPSVNHTCSANGKGASAITEAVAVSPTPGDRGQK